MLQVQIRIKGNIPLKWSAWFEGLTIHQSASGETTLSGSLSDNSALYGVLSHLRDLGLELVSVRSRRERQAIES